jgi:hypothetical protein
MSGITRRICGFKGWVVGRADEDRTADESSCYVYEARLRGLELGGKAIGVSGCDQSIGGRRCRICRSRLGRG